MASRRRKRRPRRSSTGSTAPSTTVSRRRRCRTPSPSSARSRAQARRKTSARSSARNSASGAMSPRRRISRSSEDAPRQKGSPMYKRIDHVALHVADLERSVSFYEGNFGFKDYYRQAVVVLEPEIALIEGDRSFEIGDVKRDMVDAFVHWRSFLPRSVLTRS